MLSFTLFVQIVVNSGLLFVNVYNSLVDARSWGEAIPRSLATARQYASQYSPADFFRYFGPVQLLTAALNIILFWGEPNSRYFLIAAFALYSTTEILTVKYFFPRNEILFRHGDLSDSHYLRRTWREWSQMNWVRSGLMLLALMLTIYAFEMVFILPSH